MPRNFDEPVKKDLIIQNMQISETLPNWIDSHLQMTRLEDDSHWLMNGLETEKEAWALEVANKF